VSASPSKSGHTQSWHQCLQGAISRSRGLVALFVPLTPRALPSACQLPTPAADRVDELANRVDHELRLLLVYLVTAVRVRDVLRIRHELGKSFLCLFLRGVGDVAEVWRNIGWQRARSNH